MKAVARSPSHITGFFEIRDDSMDPLRKGSRGAGISLALEVETQVTMTQESSGIKVTVNGIPIAAEVSTAVAVELLKRSSRSGLTIQHGVPVPIGSGFGTSAAAALGVALAGSEALGIGLTALEAAQIAHSVEVSLKTGLGTVAGEYYGGLEVRTVEGAPGIGKMMRVPVKDSDTVVALHNGPMRTSEILSNSAYRKRINSVGGSFTDEIMKKPTLQTFLKLSQEFTKTVGLATPALGETMVSLREHGYLVGMAMFGHTLFTVVDESEVEEVAGLMKSKAEGNIIISKPSSKGARTI